MKNIKESKLKTSRKRPEASTGRTAVSYRYNYHVPERINTSERARVKKERAITGRRGPGVQHHLRGNRDDDSWAFVTKKKPTEKKAVLYVGNLGTETTEEGVKEFVSRRAEKLGEKAPKVFNVKIFEPKSETRSARLTVAEGDAALLRSPKFWPRPMGHIHLRGKMAAAYPPVV